MAMNETTGPEAFGRWLDLTMANRDITGRQVAKAMKVPASAVRRWRKLGIAPKNGTACKALAHFLAPETTR